MCQECQHIWATFESPHDSKLPPELEKDAIANAEVRCPHCNTIIHFKDLVVIDAH